MTGHMGHRFPPPWTVEKIAGGFKVCDANGQSLAYVCSSENLHDAFTYKVLTEDEARRIAANIAKLPVLLGQARPDDSLEAESNLSDKRHEDEDTTPRDCSACCDNFGQAADSKAPYLRLTDSISGSGRELNNFDFGHQRRRNHHTNFLLP